MRLGRLLGRRPRGRLALLLGVWLALLGGAHAADAPRPVATAVLGEQQLGKLLDWAARLSGRPLAENGARPALLALGDEALAEVVCGGAIPSPVPCKLVAAAYDPASRRIVYRASLNLAQPLDQSFIVHELVHWLQHAAGEPLGDAPCAAVFRAEREAYAAQNRFLEQHRVHLRMGQVLRFMSCPAGESPLSAK
jgi:hypothetical protein